MIVQILLFTLPDAAGEKESETDQRVAKANRVRPLECVHLYYVQFLSFFSNFAVAITSLWLFFLKFSLTLKLVLCYFLKFHLFVELSIQYEQFSLKLTLSSYPNIFSVVL